MSNSDSSDVDSDNSDSSDYDSDIITIKNKKTEKYKTNNMQGLKLTKSINKLEHSSNFSGVTTQAPSMEPSRLNKTNNEKSLDSLKNSNLFIKDLDKRAITDKDIVKKKNSNYNNKCNTNITSSNDLEFDNNDDYY